MFLHVTGVSHLEDYGLKLTFNNGAVVDVDLKDELYGDVFDPLRDLSMFKPAYINSDTNPIEWPNGADLAQEFLFRKGQSANAVAQAGALWDSRAKAIKNGRLMLGAARFSFARFAL